MRVHGGQPVQQTQSGAERQARGKKSSDGVASVFISRGD